MEFFIKSPRAVIGMNIYSILVSLIDDYPDTTIKFFPAGMCTTTENPKAVITFFYDKQLGINRKDEAINCDIYVEFSEKTCKEIFDRFKEITGKKAPLTFIDTNISQEQYGNNGRFLIKIGMEYAIEEPNFKMENFKNIVSEIIRKVDGKFVVKSHKGKNLSKPTTKKKALKRLKQIEYFKHHLN